MRRKLVNRNWRRYEVDGRGLSRWWIVLAVFGWVLVAILYAKGG